MGASKGDVARVAYGLQALLRELEDLSYSTFPGEDDKKQRVLEVLRVRLPKEALHDRLQLRIV